MSDAVQGQEPPEVIYLQWHGDGDESEAPVDPAAVTWAQESVFEQDIVYRRQSTAIDIQGEPAANEQQRFQRLWDHVTSTEGGHCGHEPSDLMQAVHNAILASLSRDGQFDYAQIRRVGQRIAKQREPLQIVTTIRPWLSLVTGEWQVTSADLESWACLSLFAGREYPEGEWSAMFGAIGESLRKKRRTQVFESFHGVTSEHRKLLAALNWEMDYFRGDWVSLFVDGKRPMGDAARTHEMALLLGWTFTEDAAGDVRLTADQEERAWELFDQLPFALNDLLKLE